MTGRVRTIASAALVAASVLGASVAAVPAAHAGARVQLAPAAGPAGSTAHIAGAGFGRRAAIRVRVGRRVVARGRATSAGRLRRTFRLPRAGRLPVIRTSGGGRVVVNRFRVTAQPGATDTSELAVAAGARIRWSPRIVEPGGVLKVTAAGLGRRARTTFRVGTRRARTSRATRGGKLNTTLRMPRRVGIVTIRARAGRINLPFRVQVGQRHGRAAPQAAPSARLIARNESPPGTRFTFLAPTGSFQVPAGGEQAALVPPGRYVVTLADTPGHVLDRIACDDTDSFGSVAERRATFVAAAGETVRCTFFSSVKPPPPIIAAAGDVACDPKDDGFNGLLGTSQSCRMRDTADLMAAQPGLSAVLGLGDLQYEEGRFAQFTGSYELTWGRLRAVTKPAIGNHEYLTSKGAGYWDYWNGIMARTGQGGERGKGWYSFDLGTWHLIALNSTCSQAGGCQEGSEQHRWLQADLAAHRNRCTLAYFHHPVFSSGQHGDSPQMDDMFRLLYASGADVVLAGHDHNYERFAPMSPAGAVDPNGIRSFVVGTGGKNHRPVNRARRGSEVRDSTSFGVLFMTLHDASYEWRFEPVPGAPFRDSGSATCR